jgi:hypothetical protein
MWLVLGAPSPVPGQDARRAVVDQLRRAEYHRGDESIVDHVWHWLGARLDSLLSGSPGGNALLVVLVIIGAVVVVAVTRAGPLRLGRRSARPGDPLAPEPATDHAARALAFSAEGRDAEALREWLRDAVRTVERRGVLAPRAGRTGAAVAREAGPLLPAAAGDLARAATAFDEVWFGERPATAADVAAARSAAESVRTARVEAPTVSGEFVLPR